MSSSQNNSSRDPLLQVPRHAVQEFCENVSALWCQNNVVEILMEEPTALRFLRDFVALSRPCIIRNAVINQEDGRPFLLTLDELVEHYPDLVLTVDATPDGHGDCLREVLARAAGSTSMNDDDNEATDDPKNNETTASMMFVKPQECAMTLSAFLQGLRASQNHTFPPCQQKIHQRIFPRANTVDDTEAPLDPERERTSINQDQEPPVLYYSRQNDCLRQDLGPLWESLTVHTQRLPMSFPWAEEAFGTTVDAINLWMGNERAVSSMHKDHYENLFYVASGEKIFTICPPAESPFLYERPVPTGRF